MGIKQGDRVQLTELHHGQKLLGGFCIGQTGTVINTEIYSSEHPVIRWDIPVEVAKVNGHPIKESNCHVSTLRKI